MTVFFTSDTHFLHSMVAGLRGFASAEELDKAIVDRWNTVVRPGDMVWHLGDVGVGKELSVLACASHLNGRKHLVAGNHDQAWPGHRDARKRQRLWLDYFESVQAYAKVRVEGRTVLLSHLPYLGHGDHTAEERHSLFRLADQGEWLAHGHLHSPERLTGPRSVHVGLDAWGLYPVTEGAIAELIRETEEKRAA